MRQADLFVLSTKYEGLPNVLTEALAVGCPVVSTDAPSGPKELLEGGKYGRLGPVGDVEALARAVIQSLSEDVDRERLKERGREFHVENLVDDLLYFAGAYSASSVAKIPRSRSA